MIAVPVVDNTLEWNLSVDTMSAARVADRSWIAATGSRRAPLIRQKKPRAILAEHGYDV